MKKQKTLTGSVVSLKKGLPAVIHVSETDRELWTTVVEDFTMNPDGSAQFTTLNTEYTVVPCETYGNATFHALFEELQEALDKLEAEYHFRKFPKNERISQYNQLTSALLTIRSIAEQEEF